MQAQAVFLSLLLFGLSIDSHGTEGIPWFEKFRKFEQIYERSEEHTSELQSLTNLGFRLKR